MRSLSPVLLLVGCAYADIDDRWAETVAVCDPPDPYVNVPHAYDTSWITDACRAAVFEDFGVQTDTFDDDQLDCFLLGAANLMGRDLGVLGDVEVGAYVRAPFLRELRRVRRGVSEHDAVARLLYDYVAYHVAETRVDARADERGVSAVYLAESATVWVSPARTTACSASYATLLIHEASHAVVPDHVPCPGEPGLDCDETWRSAYGFEAAAADVMAGRCDADVDWGCAEAAASRDLAASLILQDP